MILLTLLSDAELFIYGGAIGFVIGFALAMFILLLLFGARILDEPTKEIGE